MKCLTHAGKTVFVFENSFLPRWLGVGAITIYPCILFALDLNCARISRMLDHEMIHIDQVRRYGWFKFYWSYLRQYIANRWSGLTADQAYRAITWEVAAYQGQSTYKLDC